MRVPTQRSDHMRTSRKARRVFLDVTPDSARCGGRVPRTARLRNGLGELSAVMSVFAPLTTTTGGRVLGIVLGI